LAIPRSELEKSGIKLKTSFPRKTKLLLVATKVFHCQQVEGEVIPERTLIGDNTAAEKTAGQAVTACHVFQYKYMDEIGTEL
jgi:hypothetical protein